MSFIITTSLSIPKGITLCCPSFRAIVSSTARLPLRSISAACFLLTIFMAASCCVIACLAFLTLPVAPLPMVAPSRHGPTCVLRLDLPDVFVELEIWESRLELRASSLEMAEMRLSSALEVGEVGLLRIWRVPPGIRDSWCGILGCEDAYISELAGAGVDVWGSDC